jgi:hypothetical protein
MLIDGDSAYNNLIKAGKEWSKAEYEASLLENNKHSILAEVIQEIIAADPKTSFAKAENEAKASPAYQRHIAGMVAARHKANDAKVKYNATQELLDVRKCNAATERVEAKLV